MDLVKELVSIKTDEEDVLDAIEGVSIAVDAEELLEIEKHLKRLYKNKLAELCWSGAINVGFERVVKAPLYLAAMDYFEDKDEMARMLGMSRDKLFNKLREYFRSALVSKIQAKEKGSTMYLLYMNYFEQIYLDGDIDSEFGDMINRSMYRAVMEYTKDNLNRASQLLGVREFDLIKSLEHYFGVTKLCDDVELKEVG